MRDEAPFAEQRAARLMQRRDEILGFRGLMDAPGGGQVVGGMRFTAGGMVQESFADALLRNITGPATQIGAWRQGLQDLRAAGASEALIEGLGLDASPAELSAIRALLEDTSPLRRSTRRCWPVGRWRPANAPQP